MAEQEWWILRARVSGDSGSNTKRSVEAGATEKGPRPAPRLPTSGSSLLSLPHRLPLYPLTPISPCLQPNQPILILSHLRTSYLLPHRISSWSDLALNFAPDKKAGTPIVTVRWFDIHTRIAEHCGSGVRHAGHTEPCCGHGHSSLHVPLFISVMRTPYSSPQLIFWCVRIWKEDFVGKADFCLGVSSIRKCDKSLLPSHAFPPLYFYIFLYFRCLTKPPQFLKSLSNWAWSLFSPALL